MAGSCRHLARSGVAGLLGCKLIGRTVWECAAMAALVVDRHVSSSAVCVCVRRWWWGVLGVLLLLSLHSESILLSLPPASSLSHPTHEALLTLEC